MAKVDPWADYSDPGEAGEELSIDQALARFAQLFNAGEYHAAHEFLDDAWLQTQGADGDFLKGLIQAAICLHHLSRGNFEGAAKLYSGHRRYLAAYLPKHRGIDLERLLTELQIYLRPWVRPSREAPPAFEQEQVPRIVLEDQ